MSRRVVCQTRKEYLEKYIEHDMPGNRFEVEVHVDRHTGPNSKVDCRKSLQIRLDDDGTVGCFWDEHEHGTSMECVYDVPYEEFFKFMLPVLRRLKKKYGQVETS